MYTKKGGSYMAVSKSKKRNRLCFLAQQIQAANSSEEILDLVIKFNAKQKEEKK